MTKSLRSCLGLVAWCALAPVGLGQGGVGGGGGCGPGWLAGEPVAGADSIVNASTLWDPDGPGPQGLKVVVAGSFSVVGDVIAPGVAVMDVATGQWSPLGRLVGASTLAAGADGSLYAGTNRVSGMNDGPQVLRWSGTAWEPVGGAGAVFVFGDASKASVSSIAAMGNGEVVVSGWFDGVSGVTGSLVGIARWDGTTWRSVGGGLSPSRVVARGGGEIVASGMYGNLSSAGVSLGAVARWTGTAWQSLGGLTSGPTNVLNTSAQINSTVALPSGEVVVGGWFTSVGGVMATTGAWWDGGGWSALAGLQPQEDVMSLAVAPDGTLVALVRQSWGFTLLRWEGGAWVLIRPFNTRTGFGGSFQTFGPLGIAAISSQDVMLHGWLGRVDNVSVRNIARLRNGQWQRVSEGTASEKSSFAEIFAMTQRSDGQVVVGGDIAQIGGESVALMARWNGSRWSNTRTNLMIDMEFDGPLTSLTSLRNGAVLGFGYVSVGRLTSDTLAPWTDAQRTSLFFGTPGLVTAAAELPNGDIVANVEIFVAGQLPGHVLYRWNQVAWSPLASLGPSQSLLSRGALSLTIGPDGQLYVGGDFAQIDGVIVNGIARWDGQTWRGLGSGVRRGESGAGAVNAMTWLRDGRLAIVGEFSRAGDAQALGVAVWDGTNWSAVGAGTQFSPGVNSVSEPLLLSVAEGPGGEVIIGGFFRSVTSAGQALATAANVAVWDGQRWSELGGGAGMGVRSLLMLQNGELAAAGGFSAVGGGDFFAGVRPEGVVSSAFARYSWTGGPTMSVS
ncbi:MAG: hypothetical protein MUE97_05275, partial [Phycisphaerales bacterium]|nr:hypothetical protein [Phycisphaerales bacterium]